MALKSFLMENVVGWIKKGFLFMRVLKRFSWNEGGKLNTCSLFHTRTKNESEDDLFLEEPFEFLKN